MPMFLGEVLPSPSLNQATRGLRRAVVDAVPSTKSHTTGFHGTRDGKGNGMYRLVGRDVLGAPRAWGRHRDAGRRGRRPLPRMPREHHAPVPTALRPDVPPGRARRPRRAARMGPPTEHPRGRPSGTRAAGDVGPYHGCPVNTMRPCRPRCVRACRLVGRDVPGAPRAWGRQRNTHGDASGTRSAGDVGPYQAISYHSWAYLLPPATVSRSSFR